MNASVVENPGSSARDEARIDFRLAPDKKQVIEQAAAVRGISVTDFAVVTLVREAQEVLRTQHTLVLSDQDRDAFMDALDNPPVPNAALARAAKRYKAAKSSKSLR